MTVTLLFSALCLAWLASELWLGWRRRSTDSARTRDRGTLPLLQATIAVCIAVALWFSYSGLARFPIGLRVPLLWTGIALMIAGMLFRGWAVHVLARYFTVDVTIQPDHRTFYGFALALGNFGALLAIVLPVTAAFLRRIRIEERVLSEAFPTQYAAYARATKRLIPHVW